MHADGKVSIFSIIIAVTDELMTLKPFPIIFHQVHYKYHPQGGRIYFVNRITLLVINDLIAGYSISYKRIEILWKFALTARLY